jgi:hypothetical protein
MRIRIWWIASDLNPAFYFDAVPDPAFHTDLDLENFFKIRYLYLKYGTEGTITCGPRTGYSLPYAAR